MKIQNHIRIFTIATIIWMIFLIGGWPDYYLQYSDQGMIIFFMILLIPITAALVLVLRQVKQDGRIKIAFWYAFYFTVPLFIYDSFYCGFLLGYVIHFIFVFWLLSLYYLIPWILFPLIAFILNKHPEQSAA